MHILFKLAGQSLLPHVDHTGWINWIQEQYCFTNYAQKHGCSRLWHTGDSWRGCSAFRPCRCPPQQPPLPLPPSSSLSRLLSHASVSTFFHFPLEVSSTDQSSRAPAPIGFSLGSLPSRKYECLKPYNKILFFKWKIITICVLTLEFSVYTLENKNIKKTFFLGKT